MDEIDFGSILSSAEKLKEWFLTEVATLETLGQLPVVAAVLLVAFITGRWVRARSDRLLNARALRGRATNQVVTRLLALAFPILAMLLMWLALGVATELQWPQPVTRIAASLMSAWVVIKLVSSFVENSVWTRTVAVIAWTIAALNVLQLLDPTVDFLDSIAVTLGDLRISLLTIIKSLIVFGVLFWIANVVSRFVERRVDASKELSPSFKVLASKLVRIGLLVLAGVLALNSVGIDLSGLAIFTGAIGVGIGFGLQRIIANLISGLILLTDKSIKPGDVLEIGGTYGWIRYLRARYVSIITRDGTEHLIPNEMLINERVINWSYSHDLVRLKMDIGISYESDVRKAIEICLAAAAEAERVLDDPQPNCFIQGFGDSSVDLSLRIWIRDPQNGTANVRGDVFLRIWDGFHEHDIEIPYPQRDLHLKSGLPQEWAPEVCPEGTPPVNQQ